MPKLKQVKVMPRSAGLVTFLLELIPFAGTVLLGALGSWAATSMKQRLVSLVSPHKEQQHSKRPAAMLLALNLFFCVRFYELCAGRRLG